MQGEELKAMRKALGMNQQELADAIGMSRKAIGEMERGTAPIEKRTGMAVQLLVLTGAAAPDPSAAPAGTAA